MSNQVELSSLPSMFKAQGFRISVSAFKTIKPKYRDYRRNPVAWEMPQGTALLPISHTKSPIIFKVEASLLLVNGFVYIKATCLCLHG